MSQTETTSWDFVDNGDSTTVNPENILNENKIRILNTEIQWKGDEETGGSTEYNYSTNTNSTSATATSGSNTNYSTDSNSDSATAYVDTTTYSDSSYASSNEAGESVGGVFVGWGSINDIPSDGELNYDVEYKIWATNNSSSSKNITVDYELESDSRETTTKTVGAGERKLMKVVNQYNTYYHDSPTTSFTAIDSGISDENAELELEITQTLEEEETVSQTATATYPNVPSGYDFERHEEVVNGSSSYHYSSKEGETITATSNDPNNTVTVEAKTRYSDTNYYTDSDTSYASYPSVPNGYNFNRHYWRIEKNGSYHDSGYVYDESVGQSKSVTSNSTGNTWTLEMETRGQDSYWDSTTNYTENPSVSGNISKNTNITLTDGETSSWYSVSNLNSDSNTLNHSFDGSDRGYYRLRFEWEYTLPTAVSTNKFSVNGNVYTVTLADPNDSALSYNNYRVQVDGKGVLSYDLVEPSDPDAIERYIYHPTHGKLALREKTN